MQQLIEDLLAYSRVGTRAKEFRPVKLAAVLERARVNLRAALEESGDELMHDPLPEVEGDQSQLVQLLQNLVGNALKFHGEATPRIHVSSFEKENEWEIAVTDNGIGLAICRKMVDRHGGRIWVESAPRKGSSFKFTLPKKRGNHHV